VGKIKKLEKAIRDKEIIEAALSGIRISQIAKDEKLTEATINKVIKEALESALYHFEQDAKSLLAKNYMRIDIIIEILMAKALRGEYPAIDRVDKLINTQAKLLQGPTLGNKKGESEKTIIFANKVITTASPEFMKLAALAQDDPLFIIDIKKIEEQNVE